MKSSALKYNVVTTLVGLITLIISLMPFHAFLSVWGASIFGHYTVLRLWKELLLAILTAGTFYLILNDDKVRTRTLTRRLVLLILLYSLVVLLRGLLAQRVGDVTLKALSYGVLIDLRYLLFFLITWAVTVRTTRMGAHWQRLVLWPAVVVVIFGVLQVFVLPHDFLRHFGYGPQTIPPFETVNSNSHYVRIISTLRGANPLGAYLIVPLSVFTGLVLVGKRQWYYIVGLLATLVTLGFTFSRSAWIGALVSVLAVSVLAISKKKWSKQVIIAGIVGVFIFGGVALVFRHNTKFENVVFHTQTHSAIKSTSDEGHVSALRSGLHDVIHEPFGRGPGTAGPASVYNNHPARIAENYYLQIGQETGWLGLLLFVAITAGVGFLLWLRRDEPLAAALFASLIGLTIVNLLSHAWADDTLAYVWWGLAGIAVAEPPQLKKINE